MIDKKLQKKIQDWLESPFDSRNIEEGALCLLKINRNQIMYRNAVMHPAKYAKHIEYQLKKYYNKNVARSTASRANTSPCPRIIQPMSLRLASAPTTIICL